MSREIVSASLRPCVRVGLMRHFPVEEGLPGGWMTAAELHAWQQRYDAAEVRSGPIDAGDVRWQRCVSSDSRRAYLTAKAVYSGEIHQTSLLREPEIAPFRTGRLVLPTWAWRWVLRFAWMTAHPSQRSVRDDFNRRVRAMADLLDTSEEDTLVVSHAGMMAYLHTELLRRGFKGPRFRIAEHARLYLFERTS